MSRHILPNFQQESAGSGNRQNQPPSQHHPHRPYPQPLNISNLAYAAGNAEPPQSASSAGGAGSETADHNGAEPDGVEGSSESTSGRGEQAKPTYAKRGKITIVACVPCRKRKTKCDGRRPTCVQCATRSNSCLYDMTDDQRKLTHLRENVEHLQDKSNSLEGLLHTIQHTNEEEASEVFRRLRSGQDVQDIADHVQASHVLSGVGVQGRQRQGKRSSGQSNFEASRQAGKHHDFERLVRSIALSDDRGSQDIVRRLKQQQEVSAILKAVDQKTLPSPRLVQRSVPGSLESNFSRGDQTFGMIKNAEAPAPFPAYPGHPTSEFKVHRQCTPWTHATDDQELIEHLLDLYFTWQHSFFQSFPEKLFRSDMASGRTKYCSSILVNIICACGAFLSTRENVNADRGDGKWILDTFYEEAITEIRREDTTSLTTTAALSLVGYIEGTKGRLSALWMTTGRSALMATDINLHLKRTAPPKSQEDDQELANEGKARTHAFWGSYHSDTLTSFTLGRLPNYNIHAVTIDLPTIDPEEDSETWYAYGAVRGNKPGGRSSTFYYCATLSEIINATLLMFFAPTVSLSGSLLVEHYEKYLGWKHSLPDLVKNTQGAPPHVLGLHMYYHSAVLLLFRPFLKAKIINSPDIVPRDVCRQSANEISKLFNQHRQSFGMNGLCMFQVHCLLTACTIHIINIPTISATERFTTACICLQELTDRNQWALSCLKILRGLVEKWSLILPQEVEEALYRDVSDQETEAAIGQSHSRSRAEHTRSEVQPQHYTLPTEPATALAPDNKSQQQRQFNERQSIDNENDHKPRESQSPLRHRPPLQPQSPGKRPASHSQSSLWASTSQSPHEGSMPRPGTQKRQRIMASGTPTTSSNDASSYIGDGKNPRHGSRAQAQNTQPSPSSYLYSPLAGQPAPFLMPVRSSRGRSSDKQSFDRQDNKQQAQDGSEKSSGETRENRVGNHHHVHMVDDDYPGHHEMKYDEASELAPMNFGDFLDTVDGLSFDDDWRDPFMGFLEIE